MDREQKTVVAMFECAEGNETIGTAWTETGLFNSDMPIKEVLAWAERLSSTAGRDGKVRGKLLIRYADDQRPGKRGQADGS